ncbi:MAG: aldo/keto reductase [Candidatus Marinimicrobia bacterium]|nr:aldo/keto reductase [Candidatus Neomarinimicrobiota bacterium]
MKKVILGKTNELVSRISLGTWSYGGANTTGEMAVGWAGQKDEDSRLALQRAWELGINHWDTADVYGDGHSETIIGSMWKNIPRKDIFLATKFGWSMGNYAHYYHPKHMRIQFENSLKNLQTDTVDLLYLHHCNFGDSEEYFDDANELLHKLQEEGKVRFIGLSDWSSKKIMKFIDRVNPDVVQPYRNVMDDGYASSGLKKWIEKNNAGVCFFSPLKHGLLTGKYHAPVTFPDGDFRSNIPDFQRWDVLNAMRDNKKNVEIRFQGHPQPVLHGLLDSLLTDVSTGCVLLGQRNVQQVEAASSLGNPLNKKDYDWIKSNYLIRR